MPKLRSVLPLAASFALVLPHTFADVVTLNSGERLEGKILSETDKELTIDVKVSAGISDSRVVQKSEIAKVSKVTPDEEAYQPLMRIRVGKNSLSAAQYEPMIAALRGYVAQYSNSVHAIDAQTALNELEAEQQRVKAGEAKINGRWLAKEEAEKEKVQLGGMQMLEAMKASSAAGDIPGALTALNVLEKTYAGASSQPEAVELGIKLLTAYQTIVDRALVTQKLMKAEREKGFASTSPANRVELVRAYQQELAQAEAAVAAAERAGKWPPLVAISEKSITTLQRKVGTELRRLIALPVDKMKKSVELETRAESEITAERFDAADATLKEAGTLWPANELVKRRQTELQKLKAAKAATPIPATPAPATPKATPHAAAATPISTPSNAPSSAAAEDEQPSFFRTPGGIVTIIVGAAFLAAGISAYKKIKGKANDVLE